METQQICGKRFSTPISSDGAFCSYPSSQWNVMVVASCHVVMIPFICWDWETGEPKYSAILEKSLLYSGDIYLSPGQEEVQQQPFGKPSQSPDFSLWQDWKTVIYQQSPSTLLLYLHPKIILPITDLEDEYLWIFNSLLCHNKTNKINPNYQMLKIPSKPISIHVATLVSSRGLKTHIELILWV